MVLSVLLARKISWELKNGNIAALRKLYQQSIAFSVSFGLLLIIAVFFFGEFLIVSTVGEEYSIAIDIVLILGLGRLVHLMAGPVMQILALSNRQKVAAKITWMIGLMNLSLSLLLVQVLGIEGAAIAGALSISIWAILLRVQVKKAFPGLLGKKGA